MLEILKNSNKVIGIKQSIKALESQNVKCVYIADDADERLLTAIIEMCKTKSIELITVESMKALGKACGIEVGAAVACVIK